MGVTINNIQENTSLDSLISLFSRHYDPLVEFKKEIVPLIESVTLMKSVGWDNKDFHLALYFDKISSLYKQTPKVLEKIVAGDKTTELILKRIISSVVREREDYSSKDYNSLRLLASSLNPKIPYLDERLDKISDDLKENNDYKNIEDYARKIYDIYFSQQAHGYEFAKQVVKSYFQFHMNDARDKYILDGQFSVFYYFFGETGIETCHLNGKEVILSEHIRKFKDSLEKVHKKYRGENVSLFAFGNFAKESVLLKKYGQYLKAKDVHLFPIR